MSVDPDVDVHVPAQRRELARTHGGVLAVIALGGGLGALARFGIAQWLPTTPGHFPLGTFVINVVGCFLIGVLMIRWGQRPLLRPFLGVGILGGFTTFSTYAVETRALLSPGEVPLGLLYLFGTLAGAMLAVLAGVVLMRLLTRRPAGVSA
ncbi:fluoride efflux transporter CrcB [Kutzneria buriramensis]|uniref:Fluoride-specific ion channel FluC n=1 Tax=Kutzneria buriramensis TaxID=1045776 RepID=A0A3E0HGS3_9PSEU|nr:fluoride efflux transporter CrcB [Kutzneria buriramensis]REH44939.1 CrcB protein [Kutzneria buriramensis]